MVRVVANPQSYFDLNQPRPVLAGPVDFKAQFNTTYFVVFRVLGWKINR